MAVVAMKLKDYFRLAPGLRSVRRGQSVSLYNRSPARSSALPHQTKSRSFSVLHYRVNTRRHCSISPWPAIIINKQSYLASSYHPQYRHTSASCGHDNRHNQQPSAGILL